MKPQVILPLLLLTLLGGLAGGWERMQGYQLLAELAQHHGLLMVGGWLGGVIALERAVVQKHWIWLVFPLSCGFTIGLVWIGAADWALVLQTIASVGLIGCYLKRWPPHPHVSDYAMLTGAVLWLLANIRLMITGFVPGMVALWGGFILLTILGERLELSRFVPVPLWARRTLHALLASLVISLWLPFHGVGRVVYAALILLITMWFVRYDLARVSARKAGWFRYTGVSMLVAYGWLLVHGISAIALTTVPYFYDLYIHSLFLGFAFTMIWAHAPIILPAVLKRSRSAFHPVLWWLWAVFQASLMARMLADVIGWEQVRLVAGLANGMLILLMFGATAFLVLRHQAVLPKNA